MHEDVFHDVLVTEKHAWVQQQKGVARHWRIRMAIGLCPFGLAGNGRVRQLPRRLHGTLVLQGAHVRIVLKEVGAMAAQRRQEDRDAAFVASYIRARRANRERKETELRDIISFLLAQRFCRWI
jgi:hypothetical protein